MSEKASTGGGEKVSGLYWRRVAKELFFEEFAEPKQFYEQYYTEPATLYMELAKRITASVIAGETIPANLDITDKIAVNLNASKDQLVLAAAYKTMSEAYSTDVTNNNYRELDRFVERYRVK